MSTMRNVTVVFAKRFALYTVYEREEAVCNFCSNNKNTRNIDVYYAKAEIKQNRRDKVDS